MLSVDGKEVDRKTIEHTIPLLMSIDETFDVGLDTRTPVDFTFCSRFRSFCRSIDKLNYAKPAVAVVGRTDESCGDDWRRQRLEDWEMVEKAVQKMFKQWPK